MKAEVAKVKAANPDLLHRDAFKQAAEGWQASPMNPQNGGERFPETAQEEQAAAETEYPLDEEPLPEGEPMGIESTAADRLDPGHGRVILPGLQHLLQDRHAVDVRVSTALHGPPEVDLGQQVVRVKLSRILYPAKK